METKFIIKCTNNECVLLLQSYKDWKYLFILYSVLQLLSRLSWEYP